MKESYYMRSMEKRKRRQRQVRRNIILLITSVIAILACSFFIFTMSTQASDKEHQPSYKYYKSIEIKKGDTLWSIAHENMDEHYSSISSYIEEVKRMNSLSSNQIKAGSYLIVPYYSTTFS